MQKPSLKKVIIILFIITLLIAGYFILLEKPQTAAADWWDDSWLYRQTIAITNLGTNQTDFQTMITLDSATLITANKVQSDCDDIRITDINGKLIPHWIEPSTCNTSATKIWTKVPSITTNGATLYLYYGNSAITSTSSTTDTFIREISGVQGAWDMDEGSWTNDCSTDTVLDSSGNANHGASCPNAGGTQPSTGKFGNGGIFDGSNDYVSVADDISLTLSNNWTISVWVKISDNSGSFYQYFLSNGGAGDNPSINWYFIESSEGGVPDKLKFYLGDDDTIDVQVTSSGTPGTSTNWQYLTLVKDGNTITQYVDATADGTTTNINFGTMDLGTWYIGGRSDLDSNRFFNGLIDEVYIYNQALTATEISDLYGTGGDRQGYITTNYPNKSLVRKYSASVSVGSPASEERGPGPVAYWKFDEGFGQTANDSTINANSGTLGSTAGADSSDPTWQTEDMCVTGKCLKFDGVDDYVDMGNGDSLNMTDEITIEAWAKSPFSAPLGTFVSKGNEQYDYLFYFSGAGNLRLTLGNGTTYSALQKTISVTPNVFYHYAAIFDGSIWKLYLNGKEIASKSLVWTIGNGSGNVYIGGYTPSNFLFNGTIDDVKIYPYARTAAQIKADYASRGTASGTSAVILSDSEGSRLSDGLVGYWKMDEASWDGTADEVVDASGAGNDGVAVGAGGIPTTGAGKFGNGGVFDGVDDYVDAGNDGSLDITDAITIEAWVKLNSYATTQGIVSTGSGAAATLEQYAMWVYSNNFYFMQGNGVGGKDLIAMTSAPQVGEWIHIVAVRSGTNFQWYLNGTTNGDGTLNQTPTTEQFDKLLIGTLTTVPNNPFNGSIDEVRIYNRALSPGEVRDLYNWAPGPVAHWKMDENVSGDAQTLNDISGNDNAGVTGDGSNDTGMNCMVSGKYGGGCEFDGVDDYVNAGNDASLDITDAITIEAWVKFGSVTKSQDIVAKRTAWNTPSGYRLAFDYTTVNGIEVRGRHYNYARANNTGLIVGEWYHIVGLLTETGSGNKIYINGVNKTVATSATENLASNSLDVIIGSNSPSSTGFFDGTIDDVRIYNYARTQAQILEDYAGGAGRKKQPIAHWKFDEGYGTTANNSGIGGSTLNGTLTNMASPAISTSGWTDSGKVGKGLVFDGGDDYVDAGNDASLNITSEITISAYIKSSDASGSDRIIAKANYSGEVDTIGYQIIQWNGDARFYIGNGVGTGVGVSFGNTMDNVWHYLVGSWDGTTMKTYKDGVYISQASYSGNPTNGVNLHIGNASDNSYYFDGSIDDVKIYNYALTEDEVREEYNSGAFLKLGSTGTDSSGNPDDSQNREYCIPGDTSTCNPPVGRWDFSEGTGSTVNDTSTNNNTGTWNGTGEHWDLGKVGFGGSFNGSDDYVNAGDDMSLNVGTNDITISGWLKFDGIDGTHSFFRSGASGANDSPGIWIRFISTTAISINIGQNIGPRIVDNITIPEINLNEFYYFTFVFDRSSIVTAYLNSVAIGDTVDISSFVSENIINAQNTRIGGYPSSIYNHNGSIDQVRIYDYARTPAQIAWDYNRGKPIAHWKFDECQGPTANDASGNGNNGTITIGATGTQDGIGTCTDGDSTNAWYNGRTGKYNSAMSFDGSDDYVPIDETDSFDLTSFTLGAWIKINQYKASGIVLKGSPGPDTSGNNINYAIGIDASGYGGIAFEETDGTDHSLSTVSVLPIDTWVHFMGSYDYTSGIFKVYVDGDLDAQETEGSFQPELNDQMVGIANGILGGVPTASYYFNGLIDEVKIYNYALTAEQVKMEYNAGAVRFE